MFDLYYWTVSAMLCEAKRSQLLIVDVQEKLLPAMHEGEAMVDRCAVLLQSAAELQVPTVISEQYRKGLGVTVERLSNAKGNAAVFEKMHFSCAAEPAISAHIGDRVQAGRDQIVIAGIESHVCVLQSALSFRRMGLEVYVVADAVTSRRPESVALALDRLRAASVHVVNTEMVAFEWLHVAGTPEFKAVSKLIR